LFVPSGSFDSWQADISERCKLQAKDLVEKTLVSLSLRKSLVNSILLSNYLTTVKNNASCSQDETEATLSTEENVNIDPLPTPSELSEACISMLLQLKSIADSELSPIEISLAIESALTTCRPQSESNFGIYQEIESTIERIKKMLT